MASTVKETFVSTVGLTAAPAGAFASGKSTGERFDPPQLMGIGEKMTSPATDPLQFLVFRVLLDKGPFEGGD